MKNLILYRLIIIIICQFLIFSCFNENDDDYISLATITIQNIDCDNCYQKLAADINSIHGIYNTEIYLSDNKKIILLNVKYDNKKTNIDIINNKIKEYGFNIEEDQ